jgi:hypothetical protein
MTDDVTWDGMSPAAPVVLPVDEDLAAALRWLEELLLALDDLVEGTRPCANTTAHLAAAADPERATVAQPVLDTTKVMPLGFPLVPRSDLDQLVAVTSTVIATDAPADAAETVDEIAAAECPRPEPAGYDPGRWLRRELTRAMALVQLDHGADIEALARLYAPIPEQLRGIVEPGQERVALTGPERDAYRRVVDRCLAAWRPGDALTAFLYKGD